MAKKSKTELVSPNVYESAIINAPREEVWEVIRDFNALPEWQPAIAESEIEEGSGIGSVRHLTLEDGRSIREKLLTLSDIDFKCVYTILESPMPLKNYVATLKLYEVTATNQTFGEWYAYFDITDLSAEKETVDTISGFLSSGLDSLVERFG